MWNDHYVFWLSLGINICILLWRKKWLLVTEARFTIKSSQPAALFAAFTEAFLSLRMWVCGGVHEGYSPEGRNAWNRAGPDPVLLSIPSHSRTCCSSTSPDTFLLIPSLFWNESRTTIWLPVAAFMSFQFCMLSSGCESCSEHKCLHTLPMVGEKEGGIQREVGTSLNVETSLSEKSPHRSMQADWVHSPRPYLCEKGEWEYLKEELRWEKERRQKRHRYP